MEEEKKLEAEGEIEKKEPEADGMDEKEFREFVDELKEGGLSEEEILDILYKAFSEKEIDMEDLEKAAGIMGYELKEEFKKDFEGEKPEGGAADKDQIEAAKEFKPGESEEEFKERIEKGEPADSDEDDEDEERREAMRLLDADR